MLDKSLNNKLKKLTYRPDIDGLRAVAIIAVIINHTDRSILPGGYLGVDIFFVISGFVITLSLSERESKNFISFLSSFFERRLKRLFPALIVFCLITGILIPLFDPHPGNSLRTGITGLFGFSNLYLLSNASDYFSPSTELNPFSHTWSLDVEEQFYFVFPFLIWFSGFASQTIKSRRNLLFLIIICSTISLVGYLYLFQINKTAAYYLMPTRFWEMGSGCLIFLLTNKKKWNPIINKIFPPNICLFLMLSVFMIPERYNFQSTLLIVFFTSLLLLTINENVLAYRLLTNNFLIRVGLISYSLYLYHWGILSLSRWTLGIHWWSIPIQISIIFILSQLSYKYIELPIQNFKRIKSWSTILFSALSLFLTNLILFSYGFLQRNQRFYLGNKTTELTNPMLPPYIPQTKINASNCLNHKNLSQSLKNCKINKFPNSRTIYFVGDSLNESLSQAAGVVSKNLKNNIFVHSRPGTLFPVNSFYLKGDSSRGLGKKERFENDKIQIEFKKFILENIKRNDIVVITNFYPEKFGDTNLNGIDSQEFVYFDVSGNELNNKEEFFIDWLKNLDEFINKLKDKKANIIFTKAGPIFRESKFEGVTGGISSICTKEWFRIDECKKESSYFVGVNGLYTKVNSEIENLAIKHKNFYIFDAFKVVCPDSVCFYSRNNVALYRDSFHYSNYGAREIIGPKLIKFIEKIKK